MKPILTTIFCFAFIHPLFAQNATLNYQGIARNAQGAPLTGATIAVRMSIRDAISNGNILYSETKSVTTNAFGLYGISINDGGGASTGDFDAINWSAGTRFLQTEIDPANGTAFMDMGTQQMQSVPHALSAKSLDGVANPQNGDLLEFKDGSWVSKPKAKRILANYAGVNPSASMNFIGPIVTTVIEKNNPVISVHLSKLLGSSRASGGVGLTLTLGYRKNGGSITPFEEIAGNVINNMKVPSGTRVPFTLSGTFHTTFQKGDNLEIGLVGFSSDFSSWNDNSTGVGYVEISY